ncbi:MAG: IS982 family transposase [Chloroflexi bacterium]|nr:IS982 family transposase [Chloroflexota bacterium]
MDEQIVLLFVLIDDFLKAYGHTEDRQRRMSDAEVLTTALVAMLYFGGRFEVARWFMRDQGYVLHMLSKSRFNRRLHQLQPWIRPLFAFLAELWKAIEEENLYVVDSFPIPVCDNIRISRARIYQDEAFRGYIPSKKRYFYGLKVHLMVTGQGQPVGFFLTPGSTADVTGLRMFELDLPENAIILGDKAYNDYLIEDLLAEWERYLLPFRKKNSKRTVPPWTRYWQSVHRKAVETTGSLLERLLPKHIHAVTAAGFELKVALFILALSFTFLFKLAQVAT